jgi:hypothetical protein
MTLTELQKRFEDEMNETMLVYDYMTAGFIKDYLNFVESMFKKYIDLGYSLDEDIESVKEPYYKFFKGIVRVVEEKDILTTLDVKKYRPAFFYRMTIREVESIEGFNR